MISQLLSHLCHNGINQQAASGSLSVTPDSFPQAMGFWLLTKCEKSASVIPNCQVPCSNHLIPAAESRFFSHPEPQGQTSFLEFSSHFSFPLPVPCWAPAFLSTEAHYFLQWKISVYWSGSFPQRRKKPRYRILLLEKFVWKKNTILTFQIDRFWLCASKLFPSQTYAK